MNLHCTQREKPRRRKRGPKLGEERLLRRPPARPEQHLRTATRRPRGPPRAYFPESASAGKEPRTHDDRDPEEQPARAPARDRARGARVHLALPAHRGARLRPAADSLCPERGAARAEVVARLSD